MRPSVGAQRDRLAVGDQICHRQRKRRLDDLGQPGGDVVEAAGVDRHVIAGTVDLDAGTVELGLENGLAAESFECLGDAGRGLGQHRPDGLTDPQRELRQRRLTAGQRGGRDGRQIAAQHRRPADSRGGHARGLRDGVGHHPGERALAQLAAEKPAQERLLGVGCRGEQIGNESGPARLRTLARDGADLGERRIDGVDRQRRLVRGLRQRPQRRPPDADLALRQVARQPRHDDGDLPRVAVARPPWSSRSAMRAILASRADEAPTSADAVATSISCTPSPWHDGQTSPSRSVRIAASTASAAIVSAKAPKIAVGWFPENVNTATTPDTGTRRSVNLALEVLPGRDAPLSCPRGAAQLGPVGVDTPLVAAMAPREDHDVAG